MPPRGVCTEHSQVVQDIAVLQSDYATLADRVTECKAEHAQFARADAVDDLRGALKENADIIREVDRRQVRTGAVLGLIQVIVTLAVGAMVTWVVRSALAGGG